MTQLVLPHLILWQMKKIRNEYAPTFQLSEMCSSHESVENSHDTVNNTQFPNQWTVLVSKQTFLQAAAN